MTPVTTLGRSGAYLRFTMKLHHLALAVVVLAIVYFTMAALASPTVRALI